MKNSQTINGELSKIPGRFTENMQKIMKSIASNNTTISTISEAIGKDKSQTYRAIKSLEDKGIIVQQDTTKQYFLTDFGNKITLSLLSTEVSTESSRDNSTIKRGVGGKSPNKTTKRDHYKRVEFKIIKSPKGWKESRKEFFRLQDLNYKVLGLKNSRDVQFTYDNFFVKAMKDRVVTYLESTYNDNTPEIVMQLMKHAFKVKKQIEKRFSGLVFHDTPKITGLHIAHMEDIITEIKKEYTAIRHTDGLIRVQIDRSEGIELEFMHPGLSDSDSEKWEKQIVEILDSPHSYSDLAVGFEQQGFRNDEQDTKLKHIIDTQDKYAKAILLHLDVEERKLETEKETLKTQKTTQKTLSELNKTMKEIKDTLPRNVEQESKEALLQLKSLIKGKTDVLRFPKLVNRLTDNDKVNLYEWMAQRFD